MCIRDSTITTTFTIDRGRLGPGRYSAWRSQGNPRAAAWLLLSGPSGRATSPTFALFQNPLF
eukprot:2820123-Alexandrium_andersonii.AAC.1